MKTQELEAKHSIKMLRKGIKNSEKWQQLTQAFLSVLLLVSLFIESFTYAFPAHLLIMFGFALLAYFAFVKNNKAQLLLFICLIVLFLPLQQKSLSLLTWQIIYILTTIYLWLLIIVKLLRNSRYDQKKRSK